MQFPSYLPPIKEELIIQAQELNQNLQKAALEQSSIKAKVEDSGKWKYFSFWKIFSRSTPTEEQLKRNEELKNLHEGIRKAAKNIDLIKKDLNNLKKKKTEPLTQRLEK